MGCKIRYSILHFPICFHKKQSTKKIGKTALSSEQPCLFWITYNASNESLSLHCSYKSLAKYAVPPLISSAVFLHLLLSNTMPCAFHLSPSRNRHFFERLVLMIVELNASNRIFHIYMDTSRFLLQSVHTMRKILHLLLKNTRSRTTHWTFATVFPSSFVPLNILFSSQVISAGLNCVSFEISLSDRMSFNTIEVSQKVNFDYNIFSRCF